MGDVFFRNVQPVGQRRGGMVEANGGQKMMFQTGERDAFGPCIAFVQRAAAPGLWQVKGQRIFDGRADGSHKGLRQQDIHSQPEMVVGGILVIQPQHFRAIAEKARRHLRGLFGEMQLQNWQNDIVPEVVAFVDDGSRLLHGSGLPFRSVFVRGLRFSFEKSGGLCWGRNFRRKFAGLGVIRCRTMIL